jgi:hypothetical protein
MFNGTHCCSPLLQYFASVFCFSGNRTPSKDVWRLGALAREVRDASFRGGGRRRRRSLRNVCFFSIGAFDILEIYLKNESRALLGCTVEGTACDASTAYRLRVNKRINGELRPRPSWRYLLIYVKLEQELGTGVSACRVAIGRGERQAYH